MRRAGGARSHKQRPPKTCTTKEAPTMRALLFSSQHYDQESFTRAASGSTLELHFQPARLTLDTAALASGYEVVCAFINDELDAPVLQRLAAGGTRLIALRSAGYNHVDLAEAQRLGLAVVRVPAYSPHAVAEHAVALILALNRRLHRAYNRTREGDFTLHGLTGFDLHGKTVGVVGTGQIGAAFARIMAGFGCQLLAYDPYPNPELLALGARYLSMPELLREARIISLHCPLTETNHNLIGAAQLERMRPGAILINTARGELIDTNALVKALSERRIAGAGLDTFSPEPPPADSPLWGLPTLVATPHVGANTTEARERVGLVALKQVLDVWAGNALDPRCVVNRHLFAS